MPAPVSAIPPYEVWYATLPHGGGNTQSGPRPCVVIRDLPEAKSSIVIPLTSRIGQHGVRYAYRIEPTATSGIKAPSMALVFHLRHIDRKFVTGYVGRLSGIDAEAIATLMAHLLGLKT